MMLEAKEIVGPKAEAAVCAAEIEKPLRVYFVGAHSAGKTTLAEWVAFAYRLPLIPEVARVILKEWNATLPAIRLHPPTADKFQYEIFKRQCETEEKFTRFVSDRACDHLAYAVEHSAVAADIFSTWKFNAYMLNLREARVFFVRPHKSLLRDDGVRADLDWDSVVRIDAMTKFMLKVFAVPFVEISDKSMDARVSTVRAVLGTPRETLTNFN